MATLLAWRHVARHDREALRAFECTTPGQKRKHGGRWEVYHPRQCELLVQSRIRQINPPAQPPNFCVTGWDADGLAAVALYEELDGPAQIEIHVVAVSMRYRRRGGGWADELVRHVLDEITARAIEHGADLVTVLAWIDEANRPSQELFRRVGMRQTGIMDGSTLQRWAGTYLIQGADWPDE